MTFHVDELVLCTYKSFTYNIKRQLCKVVKILDNDGLVVTKPTLELSPNEAHPDSNWFLPNTHFEKIFPKKGMMVQLDDEMISFGPENKHLPSLKGLSGKVVALTNDKCAVSVPGQNNNWWFLNTSVHVIDLCGIALDEFHGAINVPPTAVKPRRIINPRSST